jgi:hypothetical protein
MQITWSMGQLQVMMEETCVAKSNPAMDSSLVCGILKNVGMQLMLLNS